MRLSKRRQDTNGQIVAHPGIAATSFEAALEAFLTAQDATGHSKATKDDYRIVVSNFLKYMAETHKYTAIQQITEQDVLGWLAYLRNAVNRRGRSYSSRSIHTYCADVLALVIVRCSGYCSQQAYASLNYVDCAAVISIGIRECSL